MKRLKAYIIEISLVTVLIAAVGLFSYLGYGLVIADTTSRPFSGRQALEFAEEQMEFGPRYTGSPVSEEYQNWLTQELTSRGWNVILQPFIAAGSVEAQNIIAVSRDAPEDAPVVIVGTHYDTGMAAFRDPDASKRNTPVPGANRGASGTAVLLELARVLNVGLVEHRVCLAFFDAEENERVSGWSPAEGSSYFAAHLSTEVPDCANPRAVVTIDAVGNVDQLQFEQNSMPSLADSLRQVAAEEDHATLFAEEIGAAESASHLAFLRGGTPSVHIFDGTYRFRFTTEDTIDKLRADRLQRIGEVLKAWLEQGAPVTTS